MRIQHNIPAMGAYRNYTSNVSAVSKNLEKLSSGYRINRAGDDAAGLAISEKMRIQITGLEQAQSNAKSGINLIQTAEGALTEVHDMLKRMYTLAEQSANGTYDNEVDRVQLQKEVNSLRNEIDRIADATNYNGINLLDGSLSSGGAGGGATGLTDVVAAEKADAVVGGKEAQAGKWVVDLSDLTLSNSNTTDETVTFSFGGQVIGTVTVGKGENNVKVADMKMTATVNEITLPGNTKQTCTVSYSDGKFTIEMKKAPTTTTTAEGGVPSAPTVGMHAKTADKVTVNIGKKDDAAVSSLGTTAAIVSDFAAQTVAEARAAGATRVLGSAKFTLTENMIKDGATIKIGSDTYTVALGASSQNKDGDNIIDLTDIEEDGVDGKITDGTIAKRVAEAAKDNSQFIVGADEGDGNIKLTEKEDSGLDYVGSAIVGDKNDDGDADWKGIVQYGAASTESSGGGLTLQIGDTAESFNKITVSIKDMHAKAMGIGAINIGTQEGASAAMDKIKNATNYVSDVRGDLGALQNRLDHTINNLSVAQQNIQDAEATIRDVDVAQEMMAYTKNNILVQSAQAMLAQANQLPQGVLQLLG